MTHNSRTPILHGLLPLAVVAALSALPLSSATAASLLDYTLGASVLHSDNIGLTTVNPQSDTVLSPSLGFSFNQSGAVFEATLAGNLQYLDYRNDTFKDEPRGAFAGRTRWTILPERLQFVAEDYLSRQPVDSFSAFSPGNQQQTNVFVAGPTSFGRIGATKARTDLRFTRSTAEDVGAFDSTRYSLGEQLLRDLGPTRTLAASLLATKVDFDTGRDSDYTRYDAFATYESKLRIVDLTIDAGYSRLDFRNDQDSQNGPLFRINSDWRLTPRSTATANLAYQFSDATEDLTAVRTDAAVPLQTTVGGVQVPIRPDVYRERRFEFGYRFNGTRLDVTVAPYFSRLRYVDGLLLDQDDTGATATVAYRIRPRTTLSVTGAASQRDYSGLDRRDDDVFGSLGVDQQFNRHWNGRIDVQRRLRSSTIPGQDYDENAISVSVSYRR